MQKCFFASSYVLQNGCFSNMLPYIYNPNSPTLFYNVYPFHACLQITAFIYYFFYIFYAIILNEISITNEYAL